MKVPAKIPSIPLGAKGIQLSGATYFAPTITNDIIIDKLTNTIIPATLVDSLTPFINKIVKRSTIKIAGIFIATGISIPNGRWINGILSCKFHPYLSHIAYIERKSFLSHKGKFITKSGRISLNPFKS